jgi:hypothetical protein
MGCHCLGADLLVAERAQEPVLAAINTETDLQVRTLLKDVVQLLATHAAHTPREAERWVDLLATVVSGTPVWLQANVGTYGAHAPRSPKKHDRGREARTISALRQSTGTPMPMMRAQSFDARPRPGSMRGSLVGGLPEDGRVGSGDWGEGGKEAEQDEGFNEGVLSGAGGMQVCEPSPLERSCMLLLHEISLCRTNLVVILCTVPGCIMLICCAGERQG